MRRLFIAAIILVNVGTASAISGVIDTPVRSFESTVAKNGKSRPESFRLEVGVRDGKGKLLATPVIDARIDTPVVAYAGAGEHIFTLGASIQMPRDPRLSYNPPAPCHIVNMSLGETGAGAAGPSEIKSMLKLCGQPITMPIGENRAITVSLTSSASTSRTTNLASRDR